MSSFENVQNIITTNMKYMQESEEQLRRKLLFETIGKIIKKHRKSQNKSMFALANECSLSRSTWYDIENASCKEPALATYWKISEALDIPFDVLMAEVRETLGENFSLSGLN